MKEGNYIIRAKSLKKRRSTRRKQRSLKKKACAYARRSPRPEKDKDNTSIEKQIEEIKKYCEANDIELVEVFIDDLKSGTSFDGRDGFKEMYNRVLNIEEEIDYIIVYKQDRLSRNPLDTLYVNHRLKELDKHLISIADNINTEDPKGEILVHIMSLVAQLERDFIAFRTGSGMEKKADEGKFLGGKVLGYDSINKELKINKGEAKIVKYIFEKYAVDRWGYRKIASNLNAQGIITKHKNKWQICSVQTVLKNKTYIGYLKWRGKYTKGKHTPIIEKSLWDETVRLMQQRSYDPQKIHPGSYPLSGLLKCPQCGSSMVQGNSGQKYKYYQCNQNKNSGSAACASNLVKKEYAEDYVLQELLKQLNNKDFISALYASTKSNLEYELKPLKYQVKDINREIEKLKKDMLTFIDLLNDDNLHLDPDMLKGQLASKQELINEKKADLKGITEQLELKNNGSIMDIINYSVTNFKEFFETISDEEKKSFFHYFIKEVHVTEGEKPKDRLIDDIIYNFNLKDLKGLFQI